MTALVVTGSVALFVLLSVLLLSLNFLSLWHWPIKAAATVITIGSSVVLYFAFINVIGWPSQDRMPDRFSLLHTRIVEPDRMTGAPGHIYLWAEEVDDRQIVIGQPRAFEVPYKVEMATEVASAQNMLDEGTEVLGEFAADSSKAPERQASLDQKGEGELHNQALATREVRGRGEGAEKIGDPALLTFSEMQAVPLPDKGAVTVIAQ